MKIFTAAQTREIDAYTMAHEPVASIDLMERAAQALTNWFVRHFSMDRTVQVFAGTGNNGGDGLAMARMLAERRFRVICWLTGDEKKRSTDCALNLKRLDDQALVDIRRWNAGDDLPEIGNREILVDALFGSGLTRPVEGSMAELIRHLNTANGTVIAVDIPSGLFGEDNRGNIPGHIIQADYTLTFQFDYTLTFQFPFLSMLMACNEAYVGSWRVLDIGLHKDIIRDTDSPYRVNNRNMVKKRLPVRNRFAHKGSCGHALLIAGSYGMMGAAVLAGEAALRSGAGLVSMHIPQKGYGIIQTTIPEALISLDEDENVFSSFVPLDTFRAVAVGPGIGKHSKTADALKNLLQYVKVPLVIDADALNLLATEPGLLELLPANTILTPHPGEFDRLTQYSGDSYGRLQKAREFAREHRLILVLKGAFTAVISPEGRCWFNPTGNPGMATGGSGDVLTGIIVSLLAQGTGALDAAVAATFLHGLAGDLAASETGEVALIAGDINRFIGKAWVRISKDALWNRNSLGAVIPVPEV